MTAYLIVFVGGGIGAACRHGVNQASSTWLGLDFPYGTLFVNIVGGLLMGALAEFFLIRGSGQEARLFLATGVVGGFTTFSAFSMDAVQIWLRGDHALCAAYVIGSVALSLAAVSAGMVAMRAAL